MPIMHKDVEILLKAVRPDLPLFMMGHSMGCAIISSVLGLNPDLNVAGVIFLSGMFSMPKDHNMSKIKLEFLKLISKDLGVPFEFSSYKTLNRTC
jgi:alpha-beta hydrolase superfamily lysophospholipase